MLPLPDAGQVPPPAPFASQVQVRKPGRCVTHGGAAGVAGSGVAGSDRVSQRSAGTAMVTPSVMVIARSALPASASVSVAALLAGRIAHTPGAATVAVLLSVPVAAAEIAQLAVYVALPPTGKFTVLFMLPDHSRYRCRHRHDASPGAGEGRREGVRHCRQSRCSGLRCWP